MRRSVWLVAAGLVVSGGAVQGRVLTVGAGETFGSLAAAAAAAGVGDTIRLGAGVYFECAVLQARDLVVEGAGAATVITDRVCEGKALLVIRGGNVTVRDLVLARARSPDANGAGIRLEAGGLTLERVRFENNQVGVLDGLGAPGRVRITDCVFEGGGVAGDSPSWALRIAGVGLLQVERSTFRDVRGGQVSSMAARTELSGNRISTGVEVGAGFAVEAGGSELVMRDNVVAAGPYPPPRDAALVATGGRVTLRGNRLDNHTGRAMTMLLDWTGDDPVLDGNETGTGDRVVSSEGFIRHRVGGWAREVAGGARSAAGAARRAVGRVVGR